MDGEEREGEEEYLTRAKRAVYEYEAALWTIEAEVQFTGLPRSVYFVSVLMEWLRFRTKGRGEGRGGEGGSAPPLFPPIRRIIKIVVE